MIYWFTGQPGSGKTTLALALQAALRGAGRPVVHLDGEFIRAITANTDFSVAGRMRNIEAGQQLSSKLAADGIEVAASFVSPYRAQREALKAAAAVLEVYLHTTAIRGRERYFAQNFEPPQADFLDIDTTDVPVGECVARILAERERRLRC